VAKDDDKRPIIIIKKVKRVEGGHHGGAWKVAYADFVTAMMAFFLLLWLLNVTTEQQKDLISSYFAPADPRIAESTSGAGEPFAGRTMTDEGAQTDDTTPVGTPSDPAAGTGREDGSDGDLSRFTEEELEAELERRDEKAFKETQEKLAQAIESVPELKELSKNLIVDMTPEGLRIQIVDQEGKPMFEVGSARPMPDARKLLAVVTQVVKDLPNKLSIRGHTDSRPYGLGANYTNWELSSDRANSSRRVMLENKLDRQRVNNVQGKADTDHLDKEAPESARNRRISIILLKQSIAPATPKPPAAEKTAPKKPKEPEKPQNRRREDGVIYFP
jgi:chemotaxis protein MotB